MMRFVTIALFSGLLFSSSATAETCEICADGAAMDSPENRVPFIGDDYVRKTCEEYNAELAQVASTSEDCLNAKIDWKVDLASYCGCEGAELDSNLSPNGGCSLCKEGETFVTFPDGISSGYPLTNYPLTCEYINKVAPFLKYITMCEEFQDNYGTDLCCIAPAPTTKSPTLAPTSSSTSLQTTLAFVVGSIAVSIAISY
mmetsp:Transcript_2133/g.3157  ORF Transcript_2133/g.3157 Transcript_2133/m.3157 type:complete len:200 (+) Transcript_2133:128-727(+)